MDSKKHFEKSYQCITFPPPQEIFYSIYSSDIWNKFLEFIPEKKSKIIDLGCGGGTCLYCLENLGYTDLFGIDFCNSIPENFLKRATFKQGDVLNSSFDSNSFDGLISTMVIEHIDENLFINEISRILKKDGIAIVTSVLKNKFAWYPYKNANGERVIEPTHIKEYRSVKEYENLFRKDFEILAIESPRLAYPIIDPIFRLLFKIIKWDYLKIIPTRNNFLKKMRKLRLPIPGYRSIEILVRKK